MKVAAIVKELQVTQQNKMETRIRLNRLFLTKTLKTSLPQSKNQLYSREIHCKSKLIERKSLLSGSFSSRELKLKRH